MTDRLKGCYVAFTEDIRTDDAESLLNAIRMIKGVASVEVSVTTLDDWMARQSCRMDVSKAIWEASEKIMGRK